MNPKIIRVAIEPSLAIDYGAEIHWTLRLLLSTGGWIWREVSIQEEAEIAFVLDPAKAPDAGLVVIANHNAWANPQDYRLGSLQLWQELEFITYKGESFDSDLFIIDDKGRYISQRDLLFDLFWLVTGQEEGYFTQIKHGYYDLTGTNYLQDGFFRQAIASGIIKWFENNLRSRHFQPYLPYWPNNKQMVAITTHDVDYPEVVRWLEPLRIMRRPIKQRAKLAIEVLLGKRNHWRFSDWRKLEKRFETPSVFFFVARQGSLLEYATKVPDTFYDIMTPVFRDIFSYLQDEGCEIGLHASYLAYENYEKFLAEKEKLERAANTVVFGNRHHYWHVSPTDIEETLLLHEKIGLSYDSSIGHNRYTGWRRSISTPYFPFISKEGRELKTLQISTNWMDDQLFQYQAYNLGERQTILREMADRAYQYNGIFVVDIHQYCFDHELFPDMTKQYQLLWQYLTDFKNVWFATAKEVSQYWHSRYNQIIANSQGLEMGK
ncbi:MAG TPA: hypothetical protein VLL52_01720 [Anaerolineae bacterium]|nr:hypothetical protein [Anaerolineae bacterium]